MKIPPTSSKYTDIPFDQYSRQEIVRQIVDVSVKPFINKASKRKLNIIDLGGHKGHTKDFFPNDYVSILDVFDEEYEGYIKGDATKTNFKDDEFDIAVSFDTLEHIPKDKRQQFIIEASRISKYAFIIAAPFDNAQKEVCLAENEANDLYKLVNSKDHPWLREHISYGIPTTDAMENYLKITKNGFKKIPTNDLSLWLATQGLMFSTAFLPGDVKEVVDVSRYYNSNIFEIETFEGKTYRQIYVASVHEEILDGVAKEFSGIGNKAPAITIKYVSLINKAYATVFKQLVADRTYLQQREKHLQEKYDELASENEQTEQENKELEIIISNNKVAQLLKKLGIKRKHSS